MITLGANEEDIRDDCVTNQTAVYDYLSNMATVAWYNYGKFNYGGFEPHDRITKQSGVIKYKTKEEEQTWRHATVHISQLADEIDFFQWGQAEQIEYTKFNFGSFLRPSSFN